MHVGYGNPWEHGMHVAYGYPWEHGMHVAYGNPWEHGMHVGYGNPWEHGMHLSNTEQLNSYFTEDTTAHYKEYPFNLYRTKVTFAVTQVKV
jgi:hypothetical protein